jgi:hypothetical protein
MRPAWEAGKEGALKIIQDGFGDQVFKTAKRYKLL